MKISDYYESVYSFAKRNWVLLLVLAVSSMSFWVGVFFDDSVVTNGAGWADQELYTNTVTSLREGMLPSRAQLHFPVGFSLLGLLGGLLLPTHPFLLVSYLLLSATVVFAFKAASNLLGRGWAVMFLGFLLVWDGVARTLHTLTEVFLVPWNNQVGIFIFAYFFWLFSRKNHSSSLTMVILSSFIAGFGVTTREEYILFTPILLLGYLLITKASLKKFLVAGAVFFFALMPQLISKLNAFGSLTTSGHDDSYSVTVGEKYFQPDNLVRNTNEVLIDSNEDERPEVRRKALFQASPWLWLALPGILLILFGRRYPFSIKFYSLVSIGLLGFYLAGSNVSAQKLAFHCIRYFSPVLILFNFATVVFLKESQTWITSKMKKAKNK